MSVTTDIYEISFSFDADCLTDGQYDCDEVSGVTRLQCTLTTEIELECNVKEFIVSGDILEEEASYYNGEVQLDTFRFIKH